MAESHAAMGNESVSSLSLSCELTRLLTELGRDISDVREDPATSTSVSESTDTSWVVIPSGVESCSNWWRGNGVGTAEVSKGLVTGLGVVFGRVSVAISQCPRRWCAVNHRSGHDRRINLIRIS